MDEVPIGHRRDGTEVTKLSDVSLQLSEALQTAAVEVEGAFGKLKADG